MTAAQRSFGPIVGRFGRRLVQAAQGEATAEQAMLHRDVPRLRDRLCEQSLAASLDPALLTNAASVILGRLSKATTA